MWWFCFCFDLLKCSIDSIANLESVWLVIGRCYHLHVAILLSKAVGFIPLKPVCYSVNTSEHDNSPFKIKPFSFSLNRNYVIINKAFIVK